MKAGEMLQRHYVAGSHSDYYLLFDEQSDRIFTARLAQHMREALDDDRNGLAAGSLPEIWMDHQGRRVWYVFDASSGDHAASQDAELARLYTSGQGGRS